PDATIESLEKMQTGLQNAEIEYNEAIETALDEFAQNAGESTSASTEQIQKMIDQVEQNIRVLETILSGVDQLEKMINDGFVDEELKRMNEIKENLNATMESVDVIIERISGIDENSDEILAFVEDKIKEINQDA